MNSRVASQSAPSRPQLGQSFSTRRSFPISNEERGENRDASNEGEQEIAKEIDEIRRYEVLYRIK
jgi:hypothetical protein